MGESQSPNEKGGELESEYCLGLTTWVIGCLLNREPQGLAPQFLNSRVFLGFNLRAHEREFFFVRLLFFLDQNYVVHFFHNCSHKAVRWNTVQLAATNCFRVQSYSSRFVRHQFTLPFFLEVSNPQFTIEFWTSTSSVRIFPSWFACMSPLTALGSTCNVSSSRHPASCSKTHS
jgi:hypothetical protein